MYYCTKCFGFTRWNGICMIQIAYSEHFDLRTEKSKAENSLT